MNAESLGRAVYLVDGCRTPFLKARGVPGQFTASDLAVCAGRDLLIKHDWAQNAIDEVVMGCIMPKPTEVNIARIIALRLGLPDSVPAWTVQRNCASGMQAIDSAMKDIQSGRHDVVLAGGTESMSHAPLLFNDEMAHWFGNLMGAKSFPARVSALTTFRPRFLKPVIALLCGLTDPVVELNMGQTAEEIAKRFDISREDMDEFAVQSHLRLAKAYENNTLAEIVPLFGTDGKSYEHDDGLRKDSSTEKLAKLKPVFDKKFGRVTAANSSQVTDGATMLLLASEDAVKEHHLPVLARLDACHWAGLDPKIMGLGPIHAATPLMQAHQLTLDDVDYWEINEAFASQVLGCIKAWQDETYCREALGLEAAFGELSQDKVNVNGGAIALGHPVGTSGARIVLHLAHVLRRNNAETGIASICIGGGQGGAMLVKQVDKVN